MQMIDVLKRLAELDSDNPNVIKEGQQVDECGMMPEMGMGGMGGSSTPASINMTAGSGPELSGMLKDIMMLAGMQQHDTGMDHDVHPGEPAPQVLEPAGGDTDPAGSMRSVIDKLNLGGDEEPAGDEEETDEAEYDNTPADPNDKNEFDADQFAHQENQPGQGDRMDGDRPKAYADMNEAVTDLFAQYKKFVSES